MTFVTAPLRQFHAAGMDDDRHVVGLVMTGTSYEDQGNAAAWLDASLETPVVNAQPPPGTTGSHFEAVSRTGMVAGDAWSGQRASPTSCDGWGRSDGWAVVGRYNAPVLAATLDGSSVPCVGCPSAMRGLANRLLAVNDRGEAVGYAEARDASWTCRIEWSWYSYSLQYMTTGITKHQIYVGPGGSPVVDFAQTLFPGGFGYPQLVGINNLGEITGNGTFAGTQNAFRFDVRTRALSWLPLLPGVSYQRSYARGINNQGHVTANVYACYGQYNCYERTMVWAPDDKLYDLLEDVDFVSMNDRNRVMGTTCNYQYSPSTCQVSEWELPSASLKVIASLASLDPPVDSSQFEMAPSVLDSRGIWHDQTLPLRLYCVKPSGEVAKDCELTLRWSAPPNSGFHVHDEPGFTGANRPPGRIQTDAGASAGSKNAGPPGAMTAGTGSDGYLGLIFFAPEPSGVVELEATGTAVVDGTLAVSDPARVSITIRVPGLSRIAAPGLRVIAASHNHDSHNGYGTADMGSALADMASTFSVLLQAPGGPPRAVPTIQVNAISLPLGGIFDFRNEWQAPHWSHRFGTDADLNTPPLTQDEKDVLEDAIGATPLRTPVLAESAAAPGASHWHVAL
ncbi:MAG TPA: hypothetical protein VFL83_13735 [Anaeromyxobacter sp.]|nr:hypothetical protein [Anaeromyxobacter sp.]